MRKSICSLGAVLVLLLMGPAVVVASEDTAHRVDINVANAAQMADLLPGIGPARAARIVQWREEHGLFEHIDQLQQIKGIGVKTVEKLRNFVRIGTKAEAARMQLNQQLQEQKVRADISRVIDAASLAATPKSVQQLPHTPWYKRSALNLLRTH